MSFLQEKGSFCKNPKDNSQLGNMRSKASANCAKKNDPDDFLCEETLISSQERNNSGWIIDSGATQHMTFDRDVLFYYIEFKQPCKVNLGDNGTTLAYCKGTCRLIADVENSTQPIAFHNVLYLPDLERNWLSVRAMTNLEATVVFEGNQSQISRNAKLLAVGKMQEKLYILQVVLDEHLNIVREHVGIQLRHSRFGHLGMDNVPKLVKDKIADGMNCNDKAERNYM